MPRRLAVLTRPNFSTYQRVQWRALAYGAALSDGRALFPSDEQFGQWVAQSVTTNLVVTPRPEERLAAMWAAANPDQFSEARAKRRLADEYDAAQERGEVASDGRPKTVPDENGLVAATAADLGLTRKDIHEARLIRDAEEADPGVVRRSRRTTRFGKR